MLAGTVTVYLSAIKLSYEKNHHCYLPFANFAFFPVISQYNDWPIRTYAKRNL